MAQQFSYDVGMVGVCLSCGLMIHEGEVGCVKQAESMYEYVRTQGISEVMVRVLKEAYQLQHAQYFGLNEQTMLYALLNIHHYLQHPDTEALFMEQDGMLIRLLTERLDSLPSKRLFSTIYVGLLDEVSDYAALEANILQYIHDIFQSLSAEHGALEVCYQRALA